MFVTTRDIRRRINSLKGNYNIKHNINVNSINENALKNVNIFEKYIDNWDELAFDKNDAFNKLMESVRKFHDQSKSKSDFTKVLYLVSEKVLPQINNIKLARVTVNKYSDIDTDNILLDECNLIIACDRVLKNQDRLNSRYDINSIISECKVTDDVSLESCIHELCDIIDSFNVDIEIKYNLALENVLYSLEKNYIYPDRAFVLETVTEYFLVKYSDCLENIRDVFEESVFYNNKDKQSLEFTLDDEDLELDLSELGTEPINEGNINKNGVKEILNKVKKIPEKTPSIIKQAVSKIYTQSANNIIDETPNFLSWIRRVLVLSTFGVNAYLGVVVYFVDRFIGLGLQRTETDKFIDKVKKEKEICESKVNKLKDSEEKKRLQEYIKTLDNNIKKLEEYRDSLYTQRELDKMNEQVNLRTFLEEDIITCEEFINNHSHIVYVEFDKLRNRYNKIVNAMYKDLKDWVLIENLSKLSPLDSKEKIYKYLDADTRIMLPVANITYTHYEGDIKPIIDNIIELLEAEISTEYFNLIYEGGDGLYVIYLCYDYKITGLSPEQCVHQDMLKDMSLILGLEEVTKQLVSHNEIIDTISENVQYYDDSNLDSITNLSLFVPDALEPKQLGSVLEDYKTKLYQSDNKDKYIIGSSIQENMFKIKTNRNKAINKNRFDVYDEILMLNEAIEALEGINETAVKTNINIAREKLKKATLKLSDKEKMMSKKLDNALYNFNDKIQKELSNKNREAVIKGRILPSASSIIKIALATGAAYMINPALAVVSAIGGIAASKAGTRREKQFILDEIDIQLKMVEKKIQLAENNNDMKSLEQLLKLEQKLKREKQRIIYRLKHHYPVTSNRD